jgi:DNA-binding GntR family transcriptional regulator
VYTIYLKTGKQVSKNNYSLSESKKSAMDPIRNDHKSMQSIVFEKIKNEILNGGLKPGDPLNTLRLSNRLGVSRTPIREALNHLTLVGLVESIPYRGAFVKKLSVEQIIELYYIRGALAGVSARLANKNLSKKHFEKLSLLCEKMEDFLAAKEHSQMLEINSEFHEIIQKATQSPAIEGLMDQYYTQTEQYRQLALEIPGRFKEVCAEHRRIYESFQRGDRESAEFYSREHYFNTARCIAAAFDKDIDI